MTLGSGLIQGATPARSSMRESATYIQFPSSRPDDKGYNALSNRQGRDLPPHTHDRMIMLSFLLYRTNPMANRLVNMRTEYAVGSGPVIFAEDEKVLEAIQNWWTDDWNDWPLRIYQRIRDLIIYGEWLHQIKINYATGETWVNGIQPARIAQVDPHPANYEMPDTIWLRKVETNGQVVERYPVKAIRKVYEPSAAKFSGYAGDVMIFGDNMTTDTLRGVGSLFTLIDYLDAYDEMLFNRLDKIIAMGQVWWDLKLQGFTQDQIDEFLKSEFNANLPPRPGTLWAHNENADLQAKTPDLKSDEMSTDAGMIKSHIVSSAGWQGTFFDDPGTAGRAVGAEMSETVFRSISTFQSVVSIFLKKEIRYALWCLREAGKLSTDKLDDFYVNFPPATTRDIVKIGPGMFRLSQALDTMVKNRTISPAEARMIEASQINQLGLTVSSLGLRLPTDLEKLVKASQDASLQAPQPPNQNQENPNGSNPKVRPQDNAGSNAAGNGSGGVA
jgi:hypothetical protein